MVSFLAAVASLLTAAAAVVAFALGVTRTARLRRREQLFREALSVLPNTGSTTTTVRELHRAALGELVARQMTSPWRLLWPWVTWLVLAGVTAQVGYAYCGYMADDVGGGYVTFSTAVFGDTLAPLFVVPGLLWMLPQTFYSYLFTLVGRAAVARNFYDGGTIERPRTYTDYERDAEYAAMTGNQTPSSRGDVVENWKRGVSGRASWFSRGLAGAAAYVPGLFSIAAGLMVGTYVWLERQGGSRADALDSFNDWWLGALTMTFSLLAFATFSLTLNVAFQVQRFALPKRHPRLPIYLSR